MRGYLDAVKRLFSMDTRGATQQVVGATVEPISHPIEGNSEKTELQPSAPAILPAKIPSASPPEDASDIALTADTEAAVSLVEVTPLVNGSSRSS